MYRFCFGWETAVLQKKDTLLGDKSNKVSSGGVLIFPSCLRLGLEMNYTLQFLDYK
jgi:hypothetical protein